MHAAAAIVRLSTTKTKLLRMGSLLEQLKVKRRQARLAQKTAAPGGGTRNTCWLQNAKDGAAKNIREENNRHGNYRYRKTI
jgi:hypothetical protein